MATVVVMTRGVGVGGRVGAGVSVLGMSVEVWRKDREGTRSGVRTIKTKGRRRRRQTLSPRAPSLGRGTEEDSQKHIRGVWGRGLASAGKGVLAEQGQPAGGALVCGGGAGLAGLEGLEGRAGLAPKPRGQGQWPPLRARLPEAYPVCPLPRQISAVGQPARPQSEKEWELLLAWTAAEELGQERKAGDGGPGEG